METNQWKKSVDDFQTGIIIRLKDTYGFIKPDKPLLGLEKRDLFFHRSIAPKGITERQEVCFCLSKRSSSKKPSAKSVWLRETESTDTCPGLEVLTEDTTPRTSNIKKESHKDRALSTSLVTGKIVSLIPDDDKLINTGIGFIKPLQLLPPEYAQHKDVHFMAKFVQCAGLDLIVGDTLEFLLGKKNKEKPTAFQPKLKDCYIRPVDVIEQFIKTIYETMHTTSHRNEDSDAKPICELLACKAVWRCVANTQLSDEGVLIFMQLIVHLQKRSKGLEGNFKLIIKEMSKSSFFNPTTGKLKQFIQMLTLKQDNEDVPDILKDFILVIMKHAPAILRPLVRIIKPLVCNEESSVETFLYKMLVLSSESQVACAEYILWDEMPLVPAANEILETFSEANLMKAKPKGPYSSVEEYVEICFRLLREDCFDALKKGIQGLMKGTLDPRDMAVFQCTRLCGIYLSDHESSLSMGLKVKPLNTKKNWNNANNLIFGNLVCITTSGNLQDNIWGTVMSRELLQSQDIVLIQLCSSGNTMTSVEIISLLDGASNQLLLIESPTYYRAFEPVLKSLQKMNPQDIPFQEELVHVQQSQSLMYQRQAIRTERSQRLPHRRQATQTENKALPVVEFPLDYIKPNNLSDLDDSQANAIVHALSKRLAIIQGPPGTGKTYIGVKLIKLLVSMDFKLPILVLTYKNHALDEFLKDVLKLFPKKVARIGGRSREEGLQKCNLNAIKRTHYMPDYQYQLLKDHKANIQSMKTLIQTQLTDLHNSQQQIVTVLKLKMTHTQIQNILLGCIWSQTDVPSLQQTDDDGFVEVKSKNKDQFKIITQTEVTTLLNNLNQSVASFLEEGEDKNDEIWVHLNYMTEAALEQWVPAKSQFEEIIGKSSVHTFSAVNETQFQATTPTNDDKDPDEEEIERLASHAQGTRNETSFVKGMFFLPQESKGSKRMPRLGRNSVNLVQDAPPLLYYSSIVNPWKMSARDRIVYIQILADEAIREKKNNLQSLISEYEEIIAAKQEIEDSFTISILNKMTVVGMTITGASIYHHLLSGLKPSIVIVEEAGEVLEPQILPVMGKWVEHLVLIGDHKQLRPSVESYVLAKQYNLDISMMERLINNDLHYETLQMQNRMREEFAELLLDIYPDLQSNTLRVRNNLQPSCAQKSVFFWTHSDPEIAERSYKNEAEARRVIKLALFFIQQEYRPSQITILAPYQGQVSLLRKMMKTAEQEHSTIFEKKMQSLNTVTDSENDSSDHTGSENEEQEMTEQVQIQTVDNYQGDENDIVIVSLVRSNDKQKVGFLNTLNRRCVAQSRARCGMYFIGNKDTLVSSMHWKPLIHKLQERDCVGTNLILNCPQHPLIKISAREADDITLGRFCKEKCNKIMPCNLHLCEKFCQPTHPHMFCYKKVQFIFAECNHLGNKQCFENENKIDCKAKCRMMMSCKIHHCENTCQPSHSHYLCCKDVAFVFSRCYHMGNKMCYENELDMVCKKTVPIYCKDCGSPGSKQCSEPSSKFKCQDKCFKTLTCGHMCTMKCSEPCSIDNCDICKVMRLAKAKKEREQKEAERKHYNEEVLKEIETLQNSDERILRLELQPSGETASEYNDIEDKVKKYIQISHKWSPVVKKIEKVENTGLRLKWLQYRSKMFDPTYEALKFHGTSAEAVDAIIEKGFIMPKPAGQMYGPGIYFATDSSKSAQKIYTKGSNMLLLCRVLLGKTLTVHSAQNDMDGKKLKERGFDSLYACRDSKKSGGVLYDEYIVFDVHQALPQYVVHYTTVAFDDAASLTTSLERNAMAQNQLKKYNIVPRRTIQMDDALDVHLRSAEAQFQRLLDSNRYRASVAKIQSVDYYINPKLLQKFKAKAQEFRTKFSSGDNAGFVYAFHGTKQENIAGIVKDNFTLARLGSATGDRGFFGAGIYFSEFPDVSLTYGKKLLLCKILPGLSYDIDHQNRAMLGCPLKPGYDSHCVSKDNLGRGEELVIFNPDQILPLYVINL